MSTTTINALYTAFSNLDAAGMGACYADAVRFEDEAFQLEGKAQVMAMWSMLIDAVRAPKNVKGREVWKLVFSQVKANGTSGSAHWEPTYLFTATGRVVHNIIDAEFIFNEQGLIIQQRDRFDFWRWSRQALGAPGLLLGWSPMLRSKVKQQAMANLRKYQKGSA
ncbi:nuclear transport factor 2 family protein [Variovorax sp. PCZ-1]|uniref:nuclear transport factor 2 family protein n=1 Tax=Variovorax sp. PCZ-1 TaxID=2835533 RepID=UPI001BD1415F|nr:nuclear transport factor 2 family protein [Variovorax sp. PCZ-1]MBS7808768.1 nuclear transport factor 2 family protein [Variovorax sp. PCZ-1]